MRPLVVCLVAATLLWPALAQAPDANYNCIRPGRTDPSPVRYPVDQRILFDTWNYENLLGSGGVLQMLNIDGEGNGWTPQPSLCREQLRVCDYLRSTQPQNNWVFTQYISYLEAIEVNVNVTYDYTSCVVNRANGCSTLQTTMYLYERNQADITARTNPNNYLPNQLQVLCVNDRGTFTRTFTFRPSANINGFYLGVQDTGTCGTINRITLYYRVCPARRDGLVTFPETPLPPAGTSQPNTGSGTCAANSSSPTSPIHRAFADGRCQTSASCACNPGFRVGANGERCQACPTGTYRSASDPANSCYGCPEKTDMTRVAAPNCACLVGYYRTRTEAVGDRCTTSPSAPDSSRSTSQTDTTITISWKRPDDGDRDDLYYIIEYRPQGSLDSFIRAGRREDTGVMDYTYTIRNLEPYTNYLITVTAENGVSDQEPDLRGTRTVEIRALTLEGVPGPPRNCRGICAAAVWQEPEQPNGVITRYEIQFFKGGSPGQIIPGSDEVFYVVIDGDVPSSGSGTVTFQVRARNSRHIGPWCVQVPLGTETPPTQPPVTPECNTNNGGCSQICTNTQGSRVCSCRTGYTLASDGRTCVDINECNTNNGGCSQICTNTPGSRQCSCRPGYRLTSNGRTCTDIDECSQNNGDCLHICANIPGSRVCSCRPGFVLDTDGRTCLDINECNTSNGECAQTCTNTQGSHQCSCRSGFTPASNGRMCQDINECNTNNGSCLQMCTNTQGSRVCSCRTGFRLASDGRTCLETGTPTPEPPVTSGLTVSISVEYHPPDDFTPGPNEYRAASGPVTVTCTATGPGTGSISYQWSSTCRDCPFQSATSGSIIRAAVHSGDTGTHTCMATRGDCSTGTASIDFNVVDAGVRVFQGTPVGNLPSNGLVISNNPGSGFRLRIFCLSDSMSENVGQLIGLDGESTSSNNFFAIARQQPGELSIENTVGSQNSLATSQQGVYTCRIPLQNGKMREFNFGIYPNGFNTRPTIVSSTLASLSSFSTLICTTTGSPATTVTWTRDGQPLTVDGHTYNMVQRLTNRAASTYDNALIVTGPVLGSTFTCTVTNMLGSDTSTITEAGTGTPCPPIGTPVCPEPTTPTDINECKTDNGGCSQICTTTRQCSCRSGYKLDNNGRTCLVLATSCMAEQTVIVSQADNIILYWREALIGQTVFADCTCGNTTVGQVSRVCGGDIESGAIWEPPDDSICNFTTPVREICQLFNTNPDEMLEVLGELTAEEDMLGVTGVLVSTSILEGLVSDVTQSQNRTIIGSFLTVVDNLLDVGIMDLQESQQMFNTSARLLETVEAVTEVLPIPENESEVVIALTSFAVAAQDVRVEDPQERTFSALLERTFDGVIESNDLMFTVDPNATASVTVPSGVFMSIQLPTNKDRIRVTNFVYLNDLLFQRRDEGTLEVGSLIISTSISSNASFENLNPPVLLTFIKNPEIENSTGTSCSFWDPAADSGYGNWSTRGCAVVNETKESVICECDHLTNFAILLDVSPRTISFNPVGVEKTLEALSYIGAIISICFLILTIATYLSSKKLRSPEPNQLFVNLCFGLLGTYIVYILAFHVTVVPEVCILAGVLVHYFLLASFFAMAADAINMLNKIIFVFVKIRRYTTIAIIISWSVPAIIAAITVIPDHNSYVRINFCRPHGIQFYVGLLTPFLVLYLFNWVIYAIIMAFLINRYCKPKTLTTMQGQNNQLRQQFRNAIALSLLFGLGWALGLPATEGINNIAVRTSFQVLFIIVTAFQGLYMFILQCLTGRNAVEARKEWKRWFYLLTCHVGHVRTQDFGKPVGTLTRSTNLPVVPGATSESDTITHINELEMSGVNENDKKETVILH